MAAGRPEEAARFFMKSLELDPKNAEAKRMLAEQEQRRLAMRGGAKDDQSSSRASRASLEQVAAEERVKEQQLSAYVADRVARARDSLSANEPREALTILRLTLESVRAEQIRDELKNALARQVATQIQLTVRREQELEQAGAEQLRLAATAAQTERGNAELARNQDVAHTLLDQFKQLMLEGQYNVFFNGGSGDIAATTAPFASARLLAQQARAIEPRNPAPHAALVLAENQGFLGQELSFEKLKEYRYMLTMQDATRSAIPFPDSLIIEYPQADFFRAITERRIKRYESVSLESRDDRTVAITNKLDQPVSMPFAQETPLEDVIKYIKNATISPALPEGIPIYVDPVGLQEAEKTMSSPVALALDGVPLKRSLKLLLKQLELTYTVKDGLMTINHISSRDQPTEIRVYPVADLSIIPFSLFGGGGGLGGGGFGGGGFGGGGGLGGGGLGGFGGGGLGGGGFGGGLGGGFGGGFQSLPIAPTAPTVAPSPRAR
jgi:hypothetical protein